jgi:hypothetical protein
LSDDVSVGVYSGCFLLSSRAEKAKYGVWFAVGALLFSQTSAVAQDNPERITETSGTQIPYFEYYYEHNQAKPAQGTVYFSALEAEGIERKEVDGKEALYFDQTGEYAEWTVDIPETGTYSIFPEYYQLPFSGKDILIEVTIDGKLQFDEAKSLSLPRLWKDSETDGKIIQQDANGNDLIPRQVEFPQWTVKGFTYPIGLYETPYTFYLEQGAHRIRMTLSREAAAICGFYLGNETAPKAYSAYQKEHEAAEDPAGAEPIRQEAEITLYKNTSTLSPAYDLGNAATLPSSASATKINTIGGANWSQPGTSISWQAEVPRAGLYSYIVGEGLVDANRTDNDNESEG